MATASIVIFTALVALALGNLRMMNAMIDPCTNAEIGSTKIDGLGMWEEHLDIVKLPKYYKKLAVTIPTMNVCPTPVGVSMRVCDFPRGQPQEKPKVIFRSYNDAVVILSHNNDPQNNDFLMVSVFCVGIPYYDYKRDRNITVHPIFGF